MGRGEGPRMQEPPPKTPHFVSEKPLALEAIHILMETMNIREKKMLNKGEIVSLARDRISDITCRSFRDKTQWVSRALAYRRARLRGSML